MKKIMMITGIIIASLLVITVGLFGYKRISPIALGMHKPVFQTDGIALNGYDATSYFKETLLKGNDRFTYKWKDLIWQFATKENRDEFVSNPKKFTPEYGGYCTKAISTGFTAPSDPTIFTINEGKLYIFSSEDVKHEFVNDPNSITKACDTKWK